MRPVPYAALCLALALPTLGSAQTAGLLARENRQELPPLTLASGAPVATGPLHLKSGTYYTLEIKADGSQELALEGAEFFHAIWINEIVINDIEVRPLGVASLEFDDEGTAEISFIAIKPGSYDLRVPGSTGDSQRVEIVIE